jgi:hypothetical protein
MKAKNKIAQYLSDADFEELDTPYSLQVLGVPAESLKSLADRLQLHIEENSSGTTFVMKTSFCEFGSDRRQTVRLFAAAVVLHSYFPNASMSLSAKSALEPLAPLHLSPAAQLFLSQAGFDLVVAEGARNLSPTEMKDLSDQFRQMAPSMRKRVV